MVELFCLKEVSDISRNIYSLVSEIGDNLSKLGQPQMLCAMHPWSWLAQMGIAKENEDNIKKIIHAIAGPMDRYDQSYWYHNARQNERNL